MSSFFSNIFGQKNQQQLQYQQQQQQYQLQQQQQQQYSPMASYYSPEIPQYGTPFYGGPATIPSAMYRQAPTTASSVGPFPALPSSYPGTAYSGTATMFGGGLQDFSSSYPSSSSSTFSYPQQQQQFDPRFQGGFPSYAMMGANPLQMPPPIFPSSSLFHHQQFSSSDAAAFSSPTMPPPAPGSDSSDKGASDFKRENTFETQKATKALAEAQLRANLLEEENQALKARASELEMHLQQTSIRLMETEERLQGIESQQQREGGRNFSEEESAPTAAAGARPISPVKRKIVRKVYAKTSPALVKKTASPARVVGKASPKK